MKRENWPIALNVCMSVYVYVCLFRYVYVCMYVCVCMSSNIYSYMHFPESKQSVARFILAHQWLQRCESGGFVHHYIHYPCHKKVLRSSSFLIQRYSWMQSDGVWPENWAGNYWREVLVCDYFYHKANKTVTKDKAKPCFIQKWLFCKKYNFGSL